MQIFRNRAALYLTGSAWAAIFLLLTSCSKNSLPLEITVSPKTHLIEIDKFQFQPKVLVIKRGDVVRWENKDLAPHQIAGSGLRKWQSENLLPNDSFIFEAKSSTKYICKLHPTMQSLS